MFTIENQNAAQRMARKLTIQTRIFAKEKRGKLQDKWSEFSKAQLLFLEPAPSLAIWSSHQRRQIAMNQKEIASSAIETEILLKTFSKGLCSHSPHYGYCFPYDWEVIGAIIVNIDSFCGCLDEIMYVVDDELYFCSENFKGGFKLAGDRTGSGGDLNSLSIMADGVVYKFG